MACPLGRWTLALDGSAAPPPRWLIGGKAWSIARMGALGLPVTPAVVVTTEACHACLPKAGLTAALVPELAQAIAWLEDQTGRRFGAGPQPLLVSVRSGAPVSMPGMMDTVLNLGITPPPSACWPRNAVTPRLPPTPAAAFARCTARWC